MQQKVYTKIVTIYTYQTFSNINYFFTLNKDQITQITKNDKKNNHESLGFENRKQMQWFK